MSHQFMDKITAPLRQTTTKVLFLRTEGCATPLPFVAVPSTARKRAGTMRWSQFFRAMPSRPVSQPGRARPLTEGQRNVNSHGTYRGSSVVYEVEGL